MKESKSVLWSITKKEEKLLKVKPCKLHIEYRGGVVVDGKPYKLIYTKHPPNLDMRYKINREYMRKERTYKGTKEVLTKGKFT
jgi:hypothetical protein